MLRGLAPEVRRALTVALTAAERMTAQARRPGIRAACILRSSRISIESYEARPVARWLINPWADELPSRSRPKRLPEEQPPAR